MYIDILHMGYDPDEYESVQSGDISINSIAPFYYLGRCNHNYSYGKYSLSFGFNSAARSDYSVAGGKSSITRRGECSLAFGRLCNNYGSYSVAVGNACEIGETNSDTPILDCSIAVGKDCKVDGSYSVAIGEDLYCNNSYQFLIGRHYHPPTGSASADVAFAIGNGVSDSDQTSFAFRVDWDGTIRCRDVCIHDYDYVNTDGQYHYMASNSAYRLSNIKTAVDNAAEDITALKTVTHGTITYETGWEPYNTDQTPTLRKCGNVVTLTGAVKSSVAVTPGQSGVKFASIPTSFAPPQRTIQICQGSGARKWLLDVLANGDILCARYGTTGVTDQLAAGTWLPFHVTWILD